MTKGGGLFILVLLLSACSGQKEIIYLHQAEHQLIGTKASEELVYLDDVIDYSYEPASNRLFVLHEERSGNTDMAGYDLALVEGLKVGGYLRVYEVSPDLNQPLIMIYENDFTWVNPWCLDSGDFEKDGNIELFVGSYRATDFYPADRRPFVVTWDGEKIIKKWTGSYIGLDSFMDGRIEDVDADGQEELVLTVMSAEGNVEERVYRWDIFTFHLVGDS